MATILSRAQCVKWQSTGIILFMCPANERRRYNVTSSLIGSTHTKNDPWEQRGRQLHPTGQCQFQALGKHNITARYTLLSMQYTFTGILWQILLDKEACIRTICFLTHWRRVTHICVSKLIIIGSNNGLSPGRRQTIIWTNDGILLIRTLGVNFNEILMKMNLKTSAKWLLFRLCLNELTPYIYILAMPPPHVETRGSQNKKKR